jgi:hypothetical protein
MKLSGRTWSIIVAKKIPLEALLINVRRWNFSVQQTYEKEGTIYEEACVVKSENKSLGHMQQITQLCMRVLHPPRGR